MRSTSWMVEYQPLKIHWILSEKTVHINFFRPLKFNQSLATISRVFIQEKWLGLKFCELCGILTFSIPISLIPVLHYPWKTSSLLANKRGSSTPKNYHYFMGLEAPLKIYIQGFFFIWPNSELAQWRQCYP